jgi:hypothetical protein
MQWGFSTRPRARCFLFHSLKRLVLHLVNPTVLHLPTAMASVIQRTPTSPHGKTAVLARSDDDVVIVAAVRSAMTKVSFDVLPSPFPC